MKGLNSDYDGGALQQVKQIFQSAIERPPDERAAFPCPRC
jgi:hypothetical protein